MSNAAALAKALATLAPVFTARSEQIYCLSTPAAFYDAILAGVRNARRRIILATLYVGTESMEQRLVDLIKERLQESESPPTVHFHLDKLRGCRGTSQQQASSALLLRPLLHHPTSSLSLYMTPILRPEGWRHRWLPPRWNEVFGLSHMKFCVFDDDVLVMGANLSHSYFTNRQDRYVCIQSHPQLADFYASLMNVFKRISYRLCHNNNQDAPLEFVEPELKGRVGTIEIEALLERFRRTFQPISEGDTFLIPSLQMAPHGIRHDEQLLKSLFLQLNNHEYANRLHCTMATGYFNFSPALHRIFQRAPIIGSCPWHILAPSPECSGFQGAAGWSGHIPNAYRSLEYAFLRRKALQDRPRLATRHPPTTAAAATGTATTVVEQECIWEWKRAGWTYHAKGLWFDFPLDTPGPLVTVVGSTNFGYRSFERDLEAQLTIITDAPSTKALFREERDRLFADAQTISIADLQKERPSLPIRTAAPILRSYL